METRLTQAQLAQVVAEVDRLAQLRDAELNTEQVKAILQELNLPSDLLEDAIVQLRRREALAQQQQRHKIVIATIAMVIIGLITAGGILYQRHQSKLARISPLQTQITLNQTATNSIREVDRQTNPRVFHRVTLNNAPVGDRLSVSCDWVDPTGQTVHQSRYQTQAIDRSPWTTYCYYQLSPNAATGTWTVKMSVADRSITQQNFVVK